MRKAPVFEYERERITLRYGTRAVLCLERELPCWDAVAARHARELSQAIFAHAEREYLPVAAAELEALVLAGRGFAFLPHRVRFTAHITSVGTGLCMKLSLCHLVGGEVRMAQNARELWTADGAYRRRRVPKGVEKSDK